MERTVAVFATESEAVSCVERLKSEQQLMQAAIEEHMEKTKDPDGTRHGYNFRDSIWAEFYRELCSQYPYSYGFKAVPKDGDFDCNFRFCLHAVKYLPF